MRHILLLRQIQSAVWPCQSSYARLFSVKRGSRKRLKRKGTATTQPQKEAANTVASPPPPVPGNAPKLPPTERLQKMWDSFLSPVRFVQVEGAKKGWVKRRAWQRDEFLAWAQRLPFALAIMGLCLWEETSPLATIRLHGPSMLPTMAADQSEIWMIAPLQTIWRRWLLVPTYRPNDLIGFVPPDCDNPQQPGRISCKRIVGVPGDRVARYGSFVDLYVAQDPANYGILWPPSTQGTDWEQQSRHGHKRDPHDTIIVPEGHVWVEADCPGLGLDSRQWGPIPMTRIKGRILGRLWPLWRSRLEDPLYPRTTSQRPHPIPLDEDTLRLYNVHRMPSQQKAI